MYVYDPYSKVVRSPELRGVNHIIVPEDRRPIDQKAVDAIAESIKKVGLLNPITVKDNLNPTGTFLIAGAHRLAAFKKLGWLSIPCFVEELGFTEIEAELCEIAENLHRADLTALERNTQTARWIELTNKLPQAGAVSKGGRGNEGGVRAAIRELGISKGAADRAQKIGGLSPEAKKVAVEVGLDDNQSALLLTNKLPQAGAVSKGGRGNEGGVRAAIRELGISKGAADRAQKIGGLSPEAKKVAVEVGLDDNQSALLRAAKSPSPEQEIRKIADEKAKPAPVMVPWKAQPEAPLPSAKTLAAIDELDASYERIVWTVEALQDENKRLAALPLAAINAQKCKIVSVVQELEGLLKAVRRGG